MAIKRYLFLLFLLGDLALAGPLQAAAEFDIGLNSEDVWFSKSKFFAGEKVKIYAQIHNYGSKDVSAYVIFYQGETTIGEPQPVSVVAGGTDDAVWVDWLAVAGKYDIMVRLVGQSPADTAVDNNSVSLPVNIDNDNDSDGIGDSDDTDDDNDGLADNDEANLKTDPKNPDSDGDGVIDGEDDYPLDKNRSVKEIPKPIAISAPVASSGPNESLGDNLKEEIRNDGEVPYFKFAPEESINKEEGIEVPALPGSDPLSDSSSETRSVRYFWLAPLIFFGFLIYFSPKIFKRQRRPVRRKTKK